MTVQRYSIKESWNRIYRLFNGTTPPSDAPDSLPGEIYSEDTALSRLAELFAGSLPGETASLPGAITVPGTSVSDLDHEYGQIYTSTGTVTVSLTTSWTKITGSFQNNGLSSSNVLVEQDFSHIIINKVGTYFVGLQLSFSGATGAEFGCAVYINGVRQEQIRFNRKLNAAGDVGSASALGLVDITGTAMTLEVYGVSDGTDNFTIEAGQLVTHSLL